MMFTRKLLTFGAGIALVLATTTVVHAGPPLVPTNPQQFEVYDDTQDGLNPATDPDIGNVQAVANPGGKERLIIQVHVQGAAPDCELEVELVRDDEASNGGLDETGHTGSIDVLGTLTTNAVGNGNAHFDIKPSGDGKADTQMFGHIDLEAFFLGGCEEDDGTQVDVNEYGAAPDPALDTPFTWFE